MMSTQCFNTDPSLQYPPSLFCEEDELVLDYDTETLKNFDLFSSTFTFEELVNEIPVEIPHTVPTSVRSVREDCMWAEDRIEEKLDIEVLNNNDTRCPQLQLVSPNSIISIKKDLFMRHLIQPTDVNTDLNLDYNSNYLESPTSSTFDSSDDGCSPVFGHGFNDRFFPNQDTDEEIDVVSYEKDETQSLPTEYQRSETPETPTYEGIFNLAERSNIQCVLDTRLSHHHENEVTTKEINEKPNEIRPKRARKNTSKHRSCQEQPNSCSSSEETVNINEKFLNRSASHNHLEKKRRINLKRKFETLRLEISTLGMSDKAPKVLILNEAIHESKALQLKEKDLLMEKRALLIAHEALQNRLTELRSKPLS